MKKRLFYLAIFSLSAMNADDGSGKSHTFFVPRQVTTNDVFELALNNYHWYHERPDDDCFSFATYVKPFYQQSSKREKLARYFLRNNQPSLSFHEINQDPCAIESLWFGIEADVNSSFNGIFNFKPRRQTAGAYCNFYFARGKDCHHFWFNIAFAVLNARHQFNLCEQTNQDSGPLSNFALGSIDQFTSIIAALNNPAWHFGKFSPCTVNRTGLDDIQVKLGYDWFYCEETNNHVSPYLVGTIPTGKRQRSTFIFEPVVGSKHGTLGAGLNADYTVCACGQDLTLLFDIKYRYGFKAKQCRSFDLCLNGDWSRYLLVVPDNQHLATQPGINLFSGKANVRPRSTLDAWVALHGQWCSWDVEVGYNFWWRQQEKACLEQLASGFGIFDLAGMNGVPQSASLATISQGPIGVNKAPSDTRFVTLTLQDLDAQSAAHPTALSSTLYGALSWRSEGSGMLGLGGQYEFAHRKSALQQWAVWFAFGKIF